jgi:hypothetical protein
MNRTLPARQNATPNHLRLWKQIETGTMCPSCGTVYPDYPNEKRVTNCHCKGPHVPTYCTIVRVTIS